MDILISGASTGIGRAASIHMARLGHTVWAGVRSQKSFDDLTRLNVQGLHPVILDVCDEESIVACVSKIKKTSGMLHALVNNAGIAIGGPVEGVAMSDWRLQFETNVFGQIRVMQECLPLLRESKGRIVNISSISGKVASPFMAPYSASKHALEAISDSLRREVKSLGVKVIIVEPGAIATPIWEKSISDTRPKLDGMPASVKDTYAPIMDKFLKSLDKVVQRASPVSLVTKTLEHALLSSMPKSRYPVGPGIRAAIFLSGTLPDTWVDKLISR